MLQDFFPACASFEDQNDFSLHPPHQQWQPKLLCPGTISRRVLRCRLGHSMPEPNDVRSSRSKMEGLDEES